MVGHKFEFLDQTQHSVKNILVKYKPVFKIAAWEHTQKRVNETMNSNDLKIRKK